MRYTFEEPRFDELQPTGDQPLELDAELKNHVDTDTVVVGAAWSIVEPVLAVTVREREIEIARTDGKPLEVVRVEDDDTFLRQTKHHPVFENPLESLILRKEEDKNKWHIGSEEDVPVQDIEGFTRFRQWVARVAIEAQQKQIAA